MDDCLSPDSNTCDVRPLIWLKNETSTVDGSCHEVWGAPPEGQRAEAYFHPVTLEKLLVSRRGEIVFRKK